MNSSLGGGDYWGVVSGELQDQGSVVGECSSGAGSGFERVSLCAGEEGSRGGCHREEGYCSGEGGPVSKKRKTMLRTMIDHLLVGGL